MKRFLNPFAGYFTYLGIYRRYIGNKLFVLFALSLVSVSADSLGIMLLLPLLKTSQMTNGDLGGATDMLMKLLALFGFSTTQLGVLAFIGIVFLLKGFVKFSEGSFNGLLRSRLDRMLRSKLLRYYTRMEYSFYASRNTGHFINVLNNQINNFLGSFVSFATFSTQVVTVLGYLLFAFFLNWQFTLMAACGGAFVLLLFHILSDFTKKISRKVSKESDILYKFFIQILQSLKYLSATGAVKPLEKYAVKSINNLATHQLKLQVASAFTAAVKEPVAVFFLIVIMLFQILLFKQPIAPIIVSLVLFYRAINTIVSVQGGWQKVMNAVGGIEMTIDEFDQVRARQEAPGSRKIRTLDQGIVFQGVTFAYDREPVIDSLNLTIPHRATVAIVGESGAGKSTLMDLVTLLLKPDAGTVLIDGVPHNELDYRDWRSRIGFVTQETIVFDDTIANNISLWQGSYESEEYRSRIHDAARQAYCHKFIEELPQKYDTVVGDRGIKLSGGQRQRLFIARELFKNPQLLILDEATSALDTESEWYIQKSIEELKGKMTVVIIAHRLSTIKSADFIYVIDNGRIIEKGTYEELTALEGTRFGKMVSMQSL